MKADPEISVIMSVYNAGEYLAEALESILSQSFSDFEFIITDDASSDGSLKILEKYSRKDDRILLLRNQFNVGLAENLNKMIGISKGRYMARMDADDIAFSKRFEEQIKFLNKHKEIGVLGAQILPFGKNKVKMFKAPLTHEEIKACLIFSNPMMHPTVMFRKSLFEDNGLRYKENLRTSQDLDLWFSMIKMTRFANLPEILLRYRIENSSSSYLKNYADGSREELLSNIIKNGIEQTFPELKYIDMEKLWIFNFGQAGSEEDFKSIEQFLNDLEAKNAEHKLFDPALFRYYISRQFFRFCTKSTELGLKSYKFFISSEYSTYFDPGALLKAKFILKSMLKFDPKKND
jgi:glycosyltransferase involved in cell wall biosynthesis